MENTESLSTFPFEKKLKFLFLCFDSELSENVSMQEPYSFITIFSFMTAVYQQRNIYFCCFSRKKTPFFDFRVRIRSKNDSSHIISKGIPR